MPDNETQSKFKAFKVSVWIILNEVYKAKLRTIAKLSQEFLKSIQERDNILYESFYVSGKGYFTVHHGTLVIDQNMKIGLFKSVGKWPFTLTKKENPKLYKYLVETDEEIKFIKQFYSVLSNKYDEGNPCWGFLPGILVQHFHFTTDCFPNADNLEDCDKESYKKWKELLEVNAVTSFLLENN